MKYVLISLAALTLSANLAAASTSYGGSARASGYDCARFQSASEIQLTPGAMEVCHDRYVQLRMLHENNDKGNTNRSRS